MESKGKVSTILGAVVDVNFEGQKLPEIYNALELDNNGEKLEVDSRPSDAIALAIRTGVSIFVEEKVLDKVADILKYFRTVVKQTGQSMQTQLRNNNRRQRITKLQPISSAECFSIFFTFGNTSVNALSAIIGGRSIESL